MKFIIEDRFTVWAFCITIFQFLLIGNTNNYTTFTNSSQFIEAFLIYIFRQMLDELVRVTKNCIIISVPYKEKLEDSYTKCPNCRSIFNFELHLRNFDDSTIQNLMTSHGFTCTKKITTGRTENYYGHRTYRKIFFPEQLLKWNSPICPICGYKDPVSDNRNESNKDKKRQTVHPGNRKKLISYLSLLPKMIWPKVSKDYWIIARYEKI